MITLNLTKFRSDFPPSAISSQESALAAVRCYEFDWSQYAAKLDEIERPDDNPSWLKAVTDVDKAEGIWRGFYESVTGRCSGKLKGTNASDFALNHVTRDNVTGVMQFLPANSTNEQALKVAALAQAMLPDWVVISLNGEAEATNAEAEGIVKDNVIKAALRVSAVRGLFHRAWVRASSQFLRLTLFCLLMIRVIWVLRFKK